MRASAPAPKLRVAIYCRQSVARETEFGSIEAQREAVEAFVQSQRGEGWIALPDRYEDHGFSGGNTERPAFRRLVADIEAGKVDVVAAYKIDRISRSLPDFTRFMATLGRHAVGFVSTTQSFDTRTSMGRLTLNILASFSQFEREVISERTRDKILATRRRGHWTGGRPMLGYDVVEKQLVVNAAEAETVREILGLYLECGGLVSTVQELERRGIRNKSWTNKAGEFVRGRPFTKSSLRTLLTNPVYIGKLRCGDQVVEGRHESVVEQRQFQEVAEALKSKQRESRGPGKWAALLSGLLRCRCGASMSHTTTKRGNRVYRYYVCTTAQKRGAAACRGSRAPANEIEQVVIERLRTIAADPDVLAAMMRAAQDALHAKQPELLAESRRSSQERGRLQSGRKNLLASLQEGGAAANAIAERLADLDEQIGGFETRAAEVSKQLADAASSRIEEDECRHAIVDFTIVWDELVPGEKARVLRLLIEDLRYDAQAGELQIRLRDLGLNSLDPAVSERRSA